MTSQPPKKTIAFISSGPPGADGSVRREPRSAILAPVLLRDGLDDPLPGIAIDLSASGLRILIDARFTPSRTVRSGSTLSCELYFGDVEVRRVDLVVRRVDDVGDHQLELGCSFVALADAARVGLRRAVARRIASARSPAAARPAPGRGRSSVP